VGSRNIRGAAVELTCNLQAIDSASRVRYDELRARVGAAVISWSELADGYLIQLDGTLVTHIQLKQWMGMERLCCPFLSLEMEPAQSGVLELKLTGPEGSKDDPADRVRKLLEVKTK
jgi:hypothetical protein